MPKRTRILLLALPLVLWLIVWTPLETAARERQRRAAAAHVAALREARFAVKRAAINVFPSVSSLRSVPVPFSDPAAPSTDPGTLKAQLDALEVQRTVLQYDPKAQAHYSASQAAARWLAANPPPAHSHLPYTISGTLSLLVLVIGSILIWLQNRRFTRRKLTGLCPQCGYDLRATPTHCPECGAIPATVSSQS